jgi:hypothetical protein
VGRTDWTGGHRAEIVEEDSGAWERTLRVLAGLTEAELRAAGLAPRSVRAWIGGRPPVSRNRLAAGRLAMQHARTALGGDRHSMPPTTQGQLSAAGRRACIAPGCPVLLTGRQSAFCARHAAYPGARRKAWKVAARR